jgi:sulfate transport system substrate-binding protein
VLLSWENEAFLALNELGKDKVEVITPALSILAEPPVAVVDKVAAKHGTTEVAKAYLEFLYSEEGQEIGARNYYRARSAQALAKFPNRFPALQLFTVDELFGGWQKAQKRHFEDGGVFDRIYGVGR